MVRVGHSRVVMGVIGALVPAVAGLLSGCEQSVPRGPGKLPEATRTLTVLTPHAEQIREAFKVGFWEWYLGEEGVPVRIEWIYRGTPQCVEYIRNVPQMIRQGAPMRVPDVFFGGGVDDHVQLAEEGLCLSSDLSDAMGGIPEEIHGSPTRDPEGHWFATGLSSFGIVCNRGACQARGVEVARTWADLADPRFAGWVAVADPSASGSHRECMVLIVQHAGWNTGWQTLMRILGNARALDARSGDALREVKSGVSLATFAVNFDGLALAAESDGAVVYGDPRGATAVTPDVVSIPRMAREPELARAFVRYLLSNEGQALWGVKQEHRATQVETLYHYPIKPAVYTEYADKLAVAENPLEAGFGIEVDAAAARWQGVVLKALVTAACRGDNHIALQRAWQAVIAAGLPEEAAGRLLAPPFGEEEAHAAAGKLIEGDDAERAALLDAWAELFKQRYAEVREQLGG